MHILAGVPQEGAITTPSHVINVSYEYQMHVILLLSFSSFVDTVTETYFFLSLKKKKPLKLLTRSCSPRLHLTSQKGV